MEDKRIEAIKDWPEPQLIRDIQVFLGFANFYRRFIRNFNRIAAPLTSMLRTTDKSTDNESQSTQAENQDTPGAADGIGRFFKNLSTVVKLSNSKKQKLTKSKKFDLAKANSETDFLTLGAKETFIHLRKAFIKALILRHFNSKCYIKIETDTLGYAICRVLSQMTSDQHSSGHVTHKDPNFPKSEIGQWHPVAFFFWKMIPAETQYKTHNQELLAIVEAFKTWRHYLEDCKYEVLVRMTIITSVNSWIQKAWALVRSVGTKSSLDTTSESIIVREKLMLWLILCFASPREARPRKKHSEMRILKFFIICRPH